MNASSITYLSFHTKYCITIYPAAFDARYPQASVTGLLKVIASACIQGTPAITLHLKACYLPKEISACFSDPYRIFLPISGRFLRFPPQG